MSKLIGLKIFVLFAQNCDLKSFYIKIYREILLKVYYDNRYVCVVGDLNLDTFQSQIIQTNKNLNLPEFSNSLSEYYYLKLVCKPTKVTNYIYLYSLLKH